MYDIFLFDGVEYKESNGNVFYKKRFMGKYQNINGNKIYFHSVHEKMFHDILKCNTSKQIIKGKSIINLKNKDKKNNAYTILKFMKNLNINK